jgi:hypothetical protein
MHKLKSGSGHDLNRFFILTILKFPRAISLLRVLKPGRTVD